LSEEYEEYHGVHRDKIPWYPTIDCKKCVNCGVCVEYCKLGVYDVVQKHGEKKPIVKSPNNCVVFCTGCEGQCPAGAISFPSKKETREIIRKLEKAEVQGNQTI
jgi:NAD-dependent dihydropyrimidine dehydrogenase PreA subunit